MLRFGVNQKTSLLLTALLSCGLLIFSPVSQSSDLNQIQKQIKQQESKIEKQKREQAKLQANLKKHESKINTVEGELLETEISLKEIRKQIADADKQLKQLEKQEREQKARLAKQMDIIYRSGINPSLIERMFAQDPTKAERMKVYYQHLNQVRIEMIGDLKATQAQIVTQKEAILAQQKNHRNQLSTQKKQQQALQKAQQEHQSTLNELNKNLALDQDKLDALKANEQALRQEIQRAEQAAREQEKREREALAQRQKTEEKRTSKPYQPTVQERQLLNSTSGLGAAKKQYSSPVSGSILHTFGSIQAGEVRWKGMVIGASAGTPVKAIAAGRVILAGYLNGYGYMVIVKHGATDLSLYGFNQSVSVKIGQLVSAGQVIAQVGNTGEISRSALYFGISRKGTPVNPAGWVR
ncbi:Murein hydrolase activator EnvC precursor [Haemophilus influenzae]|uniref:murein hydrolase activator EnvC n=1 Tax=Haemophilus influenzae TaxID=727 RepID=UPI000D00D14E|nr:murein hydrolase activator EnvC [Haemophilus influenzae]PRI42650.1 Murein hydrolase activator EnvC precursor [Haemophilus influenzae]PRK15867.1 Murein hydrolase activator EnvC precursor [Haemophilus influenzae]PRM41314.1 Murein hydrolase activator EnvC precursor [Haemophilus influenzae]